MKLSRFRVRLLLLKRSRPQWTVELWEKDSLVGMATKGGGKRNNQTQHARTRCGNTEHTSAKCPHADKTCRKCGKVGHLARACRSAGSQQPKPKGHGKQSKGGKGTSSPKTFWNCGESGHLSSQCPKKKVHAVDESAATVSVAGSQETVIVQSEATSTWQA